jgi:hypothetical protein
MNDFGYYIAPFLTKQLYEPLVSVPMKYRAHDEFQLRLIHSLEPGLVEIPLYSGITSANINTQKFHLTRVASPDNGNWTRKVARKLLPEGVRERLRQGRRPAKPTLTETAERDDAIVRQYSRLVMEHPLGRSWFTSTAELTPKDLARISQYLVGVESIGFEL